MRWALNIVVGVWRVTSAKGLDVINAYSVVRNFSSVVSWVGFTIEWVGWVDIVGGGVVLRRWWRGEGEFFFSYS